MSGMWTCQAYNTFVLDIVDSASPYPLLCSQKILCAAYWLINNDPSDWPGITSAVLNVHYIRHTEGGTQATVFRPMQQCNLAALISLLVYLHAGVAYRCKGTTQKNAAIAVARLAHDKACMQRVRDLHGLDIIYQYVKP